MCLHFPGIIPILSFIITADIVIQHLKHPHFKMKVFRLNAGASDPETETLVSVFSGPRTFFVYIADNICPLMYI